jgi:Tfp pilus assembly protein PilX
MKADTPKKQEGFVLVAVAALLVVLVGFVALGVDIGVLYDARTSAQEIADSAALAGAFTFINNPKAVQPNLAINHATQVALNNSILGQPITAGDVSVDVDVANRRVTVNVTSTQNTYFARALGVMNANIGTQAVAEAADHSSNAKVKPWFIPNSVVASPKADCSACTSSPPQLLISGGEVTAWAKTKLGTSFTLKPNNPNGAIAPGDFYGVQMPNDNNSGDEYRDNIISDLNPAVKCAESYDILKGDKVGPTKQGVEGLVGKPPVDTFQAVGEYVTPNGVSDVSDALISAPIWDSCAATFCPGNNFPNGQVQLKIIGFAMLFLDGFQGSNLKAHLVNVTACKSAGPESVTGSSVLSLPLRLVRVP